jgi:TIR domain
VAGHVFVSCRRGHATAYVTKLVAYLRAAGLPTWFDGDLRHGQRWIKSLQANINTCFAFVSIMSSDAERAYWVDEETEYARQKGKPILPLLLEGEAYFGFHTTQYEDVRSGHMPSEGFIRTLRALFTP